MIRIKSALSVLRGFFANDFCARLLLNSPNCKTKLRVSKLATERVTMVMGHRVTRVLLESFLASAVVWLSILSFDRAKIVDVLCEKRFVVERRPTKG